MKNKLDRRKLNPEMMRGNIYGFLKNKTREKEGQEKKNGRFRE